jgi:hypothetical protein
MQKTIFHASVYLGVALGLMAAIVSPASAQVSATGTGQAAAGADASAGAASRSGASVTQNYYQSGESRTVVDYTGGTNNRTTVQGGTQDTYRATIRNTPDVYAPNVSGGTNSCLVGISGGGSVAGFGIGLGGNWSDPDCERRQLAALLYNTGQQNVAQEVLCASREVREARQRMGQPCRADQTQQIAQQPVMVANTTAGPVQVIGGGAVPQPTASVNTVPDWCLTASPQERRRYSQCAGPTIVR